jgi:hypothetical protein
VHGLDGVWTVRRLGGALPPLLGVTKRVSGERGETRVGPLLRLPFEVRGLELRYRPPLAMFVDALEPDGDGFRGRALAFGREYGTFELRRAKE